METKRPKSNRPIPPEAKQVFKGILFEIYQWEQELFDGTKTIFEKLLRTDSVNIIPITDDGKIIITKEEQPGYAPFWSCIGGRLDEDEDPLEGAKRELLEETGYTAENFMLWNAVQPSDTVEWALYTFIAKGCKKISEAHPDAGEKIKLHFISFNEFIELTRKPDFRNKEISLIFYRALGNEKKMEELKKLFSPR